MQMSTSHKLGSYLASAFAAIFSFGARAENPSRPYRHIVEVRRQGGWSFRTAHASYRLGEAASHVGRHHADRLAKN